MLDVPTLVAVPARSNAAPVVVSAAQRMRVLWRLVRADVADSEALWADDDYLGAVRALIGVMRGAVDDADRASPLVAALARRPSRFQSPTELIERWLKALGLAEHAVAFVANGYDSMEVIRTMTDEELCAVGIADEEARRRVLDNLEEQKRQEEREKNGESAPLAVADDGLDGVADELSRDDDDDDDDDVDDEESWDEETFASMLSNESLVDNRRAVAQSDSGHPLPQSTPTTPRGGSDDLRHSEPLSAKRLSGEFRASPVSRSSESLQRGGSGVTKRRSAALARFGLSRGPSASATFKVAADGVAIDTSAWATEAEQPACACCANTFSLIKRKHHCRACGSLVCYSCSKQTMQLATTQSVVSTSSSPALPTSKSRLRGQSSSERFSPSDLDLSDDAFLKELDKSPLQKSGSGGFAGRPHSMSMPASPRVVRHTRTHSSSQTASGSAAAGKASKTSDSSVRRSSREGRTRRTARRTKRASSVAAPAPSAGDDKSVDDESASESARRKQARSPTQSSSKASSVAGDSDVDDDASADGAEFVRHASSDLASDGGGSASSSRQSSRQGSRQSSATFSWSTVQGTYSRACNRCFESRARIAMLPEAQKAAIRALSAPDLPTDAPTRHTLAAGASGSGAAHALPGVAANAFSAAQSVLQTAHAGNGGISLLLVDGGRRLPCTVRSLANGVALLLEVVDITRTEPRRIRVLADELRDVRRTESGFELETASATLTLTAHDASKSETFDAWVQALRYVTRAVKK